MIRVGCIADDFTGATDLADNLVRAGFRVVQCIGVPQGPINADADAVVVALESRTIAAAEAVAKPLQAMHWLSAQGAQQIYVKYGSTFDSTAQRNIGLVTEASGACVQALGLQQLKIGPQIDPGVPWCHAHCSEAGDEGLHLSLRSGNFGTEDFFTKAFAGLP